MAENNKEKKITTNDLFQALVVIDQKLNYIYEIMATVNKKVKESEETKDEPQGEMA